MLKKQLSISKIVEKIFCFTDDEKKAIRDSKLPSKVNLNKGLNRRYLEYYETKTFQGNPGTISKDREKVVRKYE